mmetsp:Transcript_22554/g.55600  ORF Transcript_22554/g.55600 Transcript_22554/m.55600 type:complete len:193 (-) Transcript_22554:361-939(-)
MSSKPSAPSSESSSPQDRQCHLSTGPTESPILRSLQELQEELLSGVPKITFWDHREEHTVYITSSQDEKLLEGPMWLRQLVRYDMLFLIVIVVIQFIITRYLMLKLERIKHVNVRALRNADLVSAPDHIYSLRCRATSSGRRRTTGTSSLCSWRMSRVTKRAGDRAHSRRMAPCSRTATDRSLNLRDTTHTG